MSDVKTLTIREAAELLKLAPATLYTYVSDKKIPHLKLGRSVRFDHDALVRWRDAHRVDAVRS